MSFANKIKTVDQLAAIVRRLKGKKKVVVHCHGVFDLVHLGHIRHFETAKREGDVLIVTLTPDRFVQKGPGRPVFTESLRAEALAALTMIDYVAINEWTTASETIHKIRPDVFVKGGEYAKHADDVTGKIVGEDQAIVAIGGRMHFTHDITFSSSNLLNSFFSVLPPDAFNYLTTFRQRYDAKDIIDLLKKLHSLRVLIVGDTIIDEYHFCRALGKPAKSSSINARFLRAEAYAGGVLAVANHIAGFCQDVHLVTCVGEKDSRLDFVTSHLKSNVTTEILTRADGPTTVKRRFIENFPYTKMFEVSFLEDSPLPKSVAEKLNSHLDSIIENYDLVLVADFGHGLIGAETVKLLAGSSKYLAVNSQTNSANLGYNVITKYPRADYVCIDQEEIRMAFHERFAPIDTLVRRAASDLKAARVAVTTGHTGSIVFSSQTDIVRTPVFSTEIVDTVGAGDAYLSVTAPCAAAGYSPEIIGFVGNAVGALKIRILGNRESVEPGSLFKYIQTLLK